MDDPVKRSMADPRMIARFQRFPEGGAERKLLEDWLSGSSKAAQAWVIYVDTAKYYLQIKDARKHSLTTHDMDDIKDFLGIQDDIRKTFSSRGVEPEVLKTLFGDPIDYDVRPCSDDSLIYLLRQSHIDILIGMCHLSDVVYDGYDSISPSQSLKNKEAGVRLVHCFQKKYAGPGVRWLEMALPQYMKMYNHNVHYGKTVVVLQSSGTGKSRTMAELARSNPREHWGISVCFRGLGSLNMSDVDGYPLGDVSVFGCLDRLPGDVMMKLKCVKSEEIAASFMAALFGVVHDTIMDAKCSSVKYEEAFDKSWGISDVTHQLNTPRIKNFEKVQTNAIALLKARAEEILDARSYLSAPTVFIEPDLEVPAGTASWVTKLFQILVITFAETLDRDRRELGLSCFTFTFDECNQMNFDYKPRLNSNPPDNRITLPAMQRVIKACEEFNFWFFMPDSVNGLSDVYPDTAYKKTTSSWRLQGSLKPLPPWLYMPFDTMVPSPENLPNTPLEALRLDRLRVYGRPLWSTFGDNEIMYAASRRLLCAEPQHFPSPDSDKCNLQVLAVHSIRFVLDLTAEGAANRMAIDSVRSHLRVLTDYNASTRMLKSEVLSEPILSIAAGDILLKSKEIYKETMKILVDQLLLYKKVISLGENGETCGRIILIVNRDATVHAAGGQICVVDVVKHKIVEQPYNDGDHLSYAVRPFLLASYLRQLVDPNKLAQIDGAYNSGLEWASKVHMNFTHFVQLEDFIESNLSYEFALLCWRRGLALQCIHNQPVIDKLLVGYRGDLSRPFDPKMFVFVALHTKNRVSAAKLDLINTITCPFLEDGVERWKPEYMVILMDLDTSICFKDADRQVQVTKCKAVKGQAWSAFDESAEHSAVRINIRGLQPYLSLEQWAPKMLQLESGRGLTDFSSFDQQYEFTRKATKDALTLSYDETLDRHKKLFEGV